MPLRETFEQEGNWLFQRRSWLPTLLYPLAFAVLYFYPAQTFAAATDARWGLVCLLVSLAGLVVRAMTVGFTPAGTSGRNTTAGQVAETLNHTGIYSVVRHPLYLGNFLMWLGIFMLIGLWWFVLLCSLGYWLYYERIMYAEEEFLRRKYAAQYEGWASRTPAFLPRLSQWVPSTLEFSMRNVLKREYNGLFATVISFVAINALSNFINLGRFHVDAFWQVVFVVGLLLFLVLRTLKKTTKVLDVAGR